MAWSSSGLGRRPLKAEIGGSNPLQATMISKARSDERAFLLPLRDALTAHFAFKLRLTYLPIRFALLSGRTAPARTSLAASCSTYPIRAHPTLFSGGSNR